MKSVLVFATLMLSLAASSFAGDERSLPAPSVAAKASGVENRENREQPPAIAPAPVIKAFAPAALPAAPSAIIVLKRQKAETHRFFDLANSLGLSAAAISLTADALSTQKGLAQPGFYEMNPVARPFVKTRAGASVYSAGSLGLVAASMYLAHRTRHHKLERILPFAIAGWEGLLSARNYHVIAAKTR